MTLDELISKLTDIRDQHGGTIPISIINVYGNRQYEITVDLARNDSGYIVDLDAA